MKTIQLRHLLQPVLTLAVGLCCLAAGYSQSNPDPQMKAVMDKLASLNPKPIESLSAEDARHEPSPAIAAMAVMKDKGLTPPEYNGDIDNTELKLGTGDVKARIYTPKSDGPHPAILYIHGGGWVIADIATYESSARALAIGTGAVVVSTHYRQGPENKFPAAHNDTIGAYEWILGNAEKLKIDPKKVAVVGESAGGNMAIDICMAAQEKKLTPPVYQVLVYPVSEASAKTSPSMEENKNAKPLNTAMLFWFNKNYLNSDADAADIRMSPALAGEKLKGLPPATIIAAEIDPLRSGVEKLSQALQAQGVPVHYQLFPGVTHEFFGMGAVVDKAKQAEDLVNSDLKKAFGL
jgi:acetyl esterase